MRTSIVLLLVACTPHPQAPAQAALISGNQRDWGTSVGRLMPDQLRTIAERNLGLSTDGGEHSLTHHQVAVDRSDIIALGGVPFINSETVPRYAPSFFGSLFAGQALQNGFCKGVVNKLSITAASDDSVRKMGRYLWGVVPADDELPDLKGLVDDAADGGVDGLELVCAAMLDDPRFQLY